MPNDFENAFCETKEMPELRVRRLLRALGTQPHRCIERPYILDPLKIVNRGMFPRWGGHPLYLTPTQYKTSSDSADVAPKRAPPAVGLVRACCAVAVVSTLDGPTSERGPALRHRTYLALPQRFER